VFVAVAIASGCRHREASVPRPSLPSIAVRAVVVEPTTRMAQEEVVGTVRAKLRAAIEPKVSARIESLLVVPGQAVKAGDLIAQLDAREIQARRDQAIAVREQMTRELERSRLLLQQKSAAPAEFDAIQARERVAIGVLQEAEAMLAYTRVAAPFDGVITRKLADVGDLAAPGKPIAEIENPRALRFEADVPEGLIGNMILGTRLAVRIGASPATIEGSVVELAPIADPASRTFLVKLDLPATPGLRSGQFGRVLVPMGESRSIHVPVSALVVRGQMETVYVVEGPTARLRLVRTGQRTSTEVELLSGLVAGEHVVTEAAAQLRDGQPVTLKP
jgi:RND family efflux transporter MFP subunit